MKATYNLITNKLKLDPEGVRLSDADNERRKSAGLSWWPGQKVFAGAYSPKAEDFILSFVDEIAEDDSPDDLESRVERFAVYAENAEESAESAAARIRDGSANTERRRRFAESKALKESNLAEYWNRRIAGAISTAQHKDRPDVIADRIKRLEAEHRKHGRELAEREKLIRLWTTGLTPERARAIAAQLDHSYMPHPETGRKDSIWSLLTDGLVTPEAVRDHVLPLHESACTYYRRWIANLDARLQYERAYLEAVGGSHLLNPAPRRKPAPAPADGLKKGDTVSFFMGYARPNDTVTGKSLSLGAKSVRVQLPPERDPHNYHKKGYQLPRYAVKKVESQESQ